MRSLPSVIVRSVLGLFLLGAAGSLCFVVYSHFTLLPQQAAPLQKIEDPIPRLLAAAEQGDAEAQFELGRRYDKADGVPDNDEEAVRWYRLAAEQGLARAETSLGLMLYFGKPGGPGL